MGELAVPAQGDLRVGRHPLAEDDERATGERVALRGSEPRERQVGRGAVGVQVEQHGEVAGVRLRATRAGDDKAPCGQRGGSQRRDG